MKKMNKPEFIHLTAPEPAIIEAAADESKVPTFSMVAYNGGKMIPSNIGIEVIIDLAGMEIPIQRIPVRQSHNSDRGIGHTTSVKKTQSQLTAEGIISRGTSWAKEVITSSKNGFPWQASIGARVNDIEYIGDGVKVTVNGQQFDGPTVVVTKSLLYEISFVDFGADFNTSVSIAAQLKETTMEFNAWLIAKDYEPGNLEDGKLEELKAQFEAEKVKTEPKPKEPEKPTTVTASTGTVDIKAQMRIEAAAEAKRIAAVSKLAAEHPDILAKAIEEDWDATKTELEVLRASRPTNVAVHVSTPDTGPQVLEAALCESTKVKAEFDAKVMEAAHKQFRGRLGLQELLLYAAWQNGYISRTFPKGDAGIRELLAAGFSTASLSGILSNVANKSIMEAFMVVEDGWRQICGIAPVSDFKTHAKYALTGDFEFKQVGPDGELKHDTVDEEEYTNKANTYGRMFAITRKMIINDDLGALNQVPRRIGRGAALALNKAFWTEFMDNSAFFAAGNSNYASGTGSALTIAGLTAAELLFLNQTDPDGNPLGLSPAILLVPNALNVTASNLMNSTEVRDTTSSTKYMTQNPHAGKFSIVRSSYLSNSAYTGHSTTAWYLLANPADMATIEVVFLNGVEQPTVEQADADFNQLGIQMRGYFDFGVNMQEHRAGVKSAGA